MESSDNTSSSISSPSNEDWYLSDFSAQNALSLLSEEDFPIDDTSEKSQKRRRIENPIFSSTSYLRPNTQYFGLFDSNFENLIQKPSLLQIEVLSKNFQYSSEDNCWIHYKKNHFQVTVKVDIPPKPYFVNINDQIVSVDFLCLQMYAIKSRKDTTVHSIEELVEIFQTNTQRKEQLPVDIVPIKENIVVFERLHFKSATANLSSKSKSKENDMNCYRIAFNIYANVQSQNLPLTSSISDPIIVRGQNPARYADNPNKKKGESITSSVPIFNFQGKVGINIITPSEALTVGGNIQLTGNILKPSDKRIKRNIRPVDSKDQLEHIKKIEIFDYEFKENWHRNGEKERGVIAQQVQEVIPEAVKVIPKMKTNEGSIDNFLVVNERSLLIENVGATKQLTEVVERIDKGVQNFELRWVKGKKIIAILSIVLITAIIIASIAIGVIYNMPKPQSIFLDGIFEAIDGNGLDWSFEFQQKTILALNGEGNGFIGNIEYKTNKIPWQMKIQIQHTNISLPSHLYSIFQINGDPLVCITIFANRGTYPSDFSSAEFMWSLRNRNASVIPSNLPELNLIKQIGLCNPFFCGSTSKLSTLQIGTYPENKLYYSVTCSSTPQFLLVNIPNDNVTFFLSSNLGDFPIEIVTSESALNGINYSPVTPFNSQTIPIQESQLYSFMFLSLRTRVLFVVKVMNIGTDKSAVIQYAVKEYQKIGIIQRSNGFSWNATNNWLNEDYY